MNEWKRSQILQSIQASAVAVIASSFGFPQQNESACSLPIQGLMREWSDRREWIDRLEKRTAQFAEDVISLCRRTRYVPGLENASRQLIESANSVASNHLVMRRGRSDREFASKLQIVNEEIVESVGWLELIEKVLDEPDALTRGLVCEARELRAIFAKSKKTTNERLKNQQSRRRER